MGMKFLDRALDRFENLSVGDDASGHEGILIFILVGFVSLIALTALV